MEPEIVITGISGRFPESDSVAELSDNLYNKIDLITEDDRRWKPCLYGLPKGLGKLKDLTKFDSQFFGIHPKQAQQLDPQIRLLLESTHECIVDAGYDPDEFRGKKIGVFIGNSTTENDEYYKHNVKEVTGYTITGSIKAMLANRISYTFNFTGPSVVMDTVCSSAAVAMWEAVRSIQNNDCEAAIVGGSNLCLNPAMSMQYYKLNMISQDSRCKSFDAAASGYARSEAVATFFLQKSSVARRKYASIVHIKTNIDGYKDEGIAYPSTELQKRLIQEIYEECQVDPLKVSYVEAHGTGTQVGDVIEATTISDIFCTAARKQPLLVGSVKSNMGHSEATSGLMSVIKVIIAMEKGTIPPNLHFKTPNPNIKPLLDEKMKIVTEPTPWSDAYAAINSYGMGGVNVHIVLKSNTSSDAPEQKESSSTNPQLVLYCGRTEESVQYAFDHLNRIPMPSREFFALLHKSSYTSAKPYRGYKLIVKDQVLSGIQRLSSEKRQVWFIFSGMGTYWPGMAKTLMDLNVFSDSIKKSAEILKPLGLDIIDLLTDATKESKSITAAMTSIAIVQIALVDLLMSLGIKPDGMTGHSAGEMICAYADGCLTFEETVKAAFWRGKTIEDSCLEEGAMAALGVSWSEATELCPEGIYPSCNNAKDSVTVSGSKSAIQEFIGKLQARNIFAKEVDSSGCAFHSKYIYPAAENLRQVLSKIIPIPKPRSSRWISTTYPESKWSETACRMAGQDYFVENLISPVLFYEALQKIPKGSVVIEIGPHHLLQAILKRVIGSEAEHVGLMKRNVDNTQHVLTCIGRLYCCGLNPQIEKLYPEVKFPVPRSTPMIAPLIKWDHSESWPVPRFDETNNQSKMVVEVNVGTKEDNFLLGHCIDGRYLYPATGYLVLAWKALAELKKKEVDSLPVNFEEVKIHRATVLSKLTMAKLFVDITSAGGEFEISDEGGNIVCTGRVYSPEEPIKPSYFNEWVRNRTKFQLKQSDIYKELKLRGYEYGETFQEISESDLQGNYGLLKWTGNWIVFLDTMMQFIVLGSCKRALYLPTRLQSLKIDPIAHNKMLQKTFADLGGVPVAFNKNLRCCRAGGVEVKNLKITFARRRKGKQTPTLAEYHFVPYCEEQALSESEIENLESYIQKCASVVKLVSETRKNNNYDTSLNKEQYAFALEQPKDNEILLLALKNMLWATTNDDLKQIVGNYLSKRDCDILSETIFGRPLTTLFDVVFENANSRKLKVAEAVGGQFSVGLKLEEHSKKLGSWHVTYTIAYANPDHINKETQQSNRFSKIPWDPKLPFQMRDNDLFIVSCSNFSMVELRRTMKHSTSTLKDNGFVAVSLRTKLLPPEIFLSATAGMDIPVHDEHEFEKICDELKLTVVCKKSDSFSSVVYLLRKVPEIGFKDNVVVPIIDFEYKEWVGRIKEELSRSDGSRRIWLVSESSAYSGIVGLVNCLRQEPQGLNIRCLFTSKADKLSKFTVGNNLWFQDLARKDLVMNVFQKGLLGSYRYLKFTADSKKEVSSHAYLNFLTRGDLSSFMWMDSPLKYSENLCQVYYAPLNFRDIMLASGKLPPDAIPGDLAREDCILGLEFSGRLTSGKRVMGLVPAKGLATTVAADPNFMWDVPDEWTLEEASTVPVAYSTAYYALVVRGNLKKGDRVLIHSGSGGVGQAAIAIALSAGCEVFTTVGSLEKREFLKKRFKTLQDRNICNSRDTSFEEHILDATNGMGIDVILNSLADDKLKATLNCLASHGRFLEIGKYDLSNNSPLGMAVFLKNVSFHGILLDSLFEATEYSVRAKKEVVQLVNDGIASGTVKPIPSKVYNHDQAEQAFRFMASGKHIGKIVIKIREEEAKKQVIPSPVKFPALSRTMCDPGKSYVIIGGLGGFGFELCHWLIEKGARNVLLTSRSGVKSGYQQLCLQRWKDDGANVVVSNLNAANHKEAESLLKMASTIGTVGGIFNLAMVLRDALFINQTAEKFAKVAEAKILSTQNLDSLSRELCPQLEWFVCFSSVASGRGNAGQTNYGFANSVMERICEERRQLGLSGLAIQWGAIGDVGVVADNFAADVVLADSLPQRILSCLSVMDKFLQQTHPVVCSFVPPQPTESTPQKREKRGVLPTIANILGVADIHSINPETTLGELGMDSLMGVEVNQYLEREFDLSLSTSQLRQMKLKDLKSLQE